MGFSPSVRLKRPEEFQKVFAEAQCQRSKFYTVLSCQTQHQQARLGLVVSKKRVRLAVDRNRAKRIIRESFRRHQAQLRPLDIVIICKQFVCDTHQSLNQCLEQHWQRLSV